MLEADPIGFRSQPLRWCAQMVWRGISGASLVDVMIGVAMAAVLMGMALPLLRTGHETTQALAAAQFLLAKAGQTRARALSSGTAVGLRFRQSAHGHLVRTYIDGDGDGILASDIRDGVDRPLESPWRLEDKYPATRLARDPTVPPIGGSRTSTNPVSLGRGGILTFSPLGTSSSGTLYVRGVRPTDQYAVRVLGVTARVRLLRFQPHTRTWIEL